MDISQQRTKILEFLKSHHLGVLATVSPESKPDAALIGYKAKENFEIWFSTPDSSRKNHNLTTNSNVSFVVGWEKGKTIQFQGNTKELSEEEVKEFKLSDLSEVPTITKYINQERVIYYKISPIRIYYSDYSTEPWERIELTIF